MKHTKITKETTMKQILNNARQAIGLWVYPNIGEVYTAGTKYGYTMGRIDERDYLTDTIESVMNAAETKKTFVPGLKMLHELLTSEREKLNVEQR